jgi:CRISPR/Cas system-associated protein Csm6
MQADRVYLVTYGENDEARKFLNQIRSELHQRYGHIKDETIYLNLWDLYECLEKFREIIFKEKQNHIYINVSTGTKITSIAGMLSCMLWGATPYYAPVAYPKTQEVEPPPTEIVEDPEVLPVYGINKPRPESLLILHLLKKAGGRMRKAQLINELERLGVIRLKDESILKLSKSAKHSQLRVTLDPMEREWNYVKVESNGRRSEVMLTEQGETALRIFGVPQEGLTR